MLPSVRGLAVVDAGVEFRALLAKGVYRVANVEETCAVGGAAGGVVVWLGHTPAL